jgi:hypothetical protein
MNDWKVVIDAINVDFALNLYCDESTNSTTFPFIVCWQLIEISGFVTNELSTFSTVEVENVSGSILLIFNMFLNK